MPRSFGAHQLWPRPTDTRQYPEDFLPEIQTTLATLADIETRYEVERDHLDRWSGPETIKLRLSAQLENRHRLEREPIVQRLAELHQKMTELALFSRLRLVH